MEIITLPWGELAPKESDCVHITECGDGRWELNTSALSNCPGAEEGESEAVIGGSAYPSYEAAEAAGLAIAAEYCAGTVFVTRERANGG